MTTATTNTAITLVTDETAAAPAVRDWLSTAPGTLALDTETTGLEPRAPGFAVHQLALAGSDGSALVFTGTTTMRAALAELGAAGLVVWAHNVTFDALALVYGGPGVWMPGLRDTLTLVRTLRPGQTASLKDLCPRTQDALDELKAVYEEASGLEVSGKSWLPAAFELLGVDHPVCLAYVATDAIETARMVEALREQAFTAEHRAAANTDLRVDRVWRDRHLAGIRIDREGVARQHDLMQKQKAASIAKYGFDLATNNNACRQWVRDHGILIADLDGKETLSRDFWDRAVVPEEAAVAWEVFKAARDAATVANKVAELARLAGDGDRIYPLVTANGARTGRQTSSHPNAQNLPGRLRQLFMADEGHVLVGCDLDRVEPRVTAALSGDEKLRRAVTQDVYTELAVTVWGEQVRGDDDKRSLAKTAFLALLYGQGVRGLAVRLQISEGQAREVRDGLLTGYPQLASWMRRIRASAQGGGRPLTVAGRPIPECAEHPYKAVNYVVQGSAADVFKGGTLRAAGVLGSKALWLPVHDELIVQVRPEEADEAARVLTESMADEIDGVPITGEGVVLGERWAKA